ncbi:hypothetical protein [Scandinavium goeteborgense]|uniref:hypothetical protein n=1 Tax=Scandinavium goeteborgense TaxID=1851514 RepID=UPI00280B0FD3|nr:hypothetical protein [Scandinavium goeteborgense]
MRRGCRIRIRTQDEGQERQEAKTKELPGGKRLETSEKDQEDDMECSAPREKQGELVANRDCQTRNGL